MMTVDEFKNTPEWQKIRENIIDKIREGTDDIIAVSKTGEYTRSTYVSGYLEALKDVLNLPNHLFPSNEKPEKDEDSVAGLAIANRPLTGVY